MEKKLIAFPYYGGKNSHLNWLLPLLPQTDIFVEPFGGSMAVLLNRKPSKVEVYNDINKEVVNFFRILREKPEELIEQIALTPYSRKEFENCLTSTNDPVESARRFYTKTKQSYLSLGQSWQRSKIIRSGVSQQINRWASGIIGLVDIVDRLLNIIIECKDAFDIIKTFDSPETTFYLDPTYLEDTRTAPKAYRNEMTTKKHRDLLRLILKLEGKVAISGYNSDLYSSALSEWFKYEDSQKSLAGKRGDRQEILWTNYDPKSIKKDTDIETASLDEFL